MYELFLELLQAGIWGRQANWSVFFKYVQKNQKAIPWEELLALSLRQTVVGPVSDGLSSLREQLKRVELPADDLAKMSPSKDVVRKFVKQVISVEDRYKRSVELNREICKIIPGPFVVGKGIGLAAVYPRPELRYSSDIDLLVPLQKYDTAKQAMTIWADNRLGEEKRDLETKFLKGRILIELHGTANMRITGQMDRVLNLLKEEMFDTGCADALSVDKDTKVPIPDATFNSLYILAHILHHFYRGGIAIKAFCDWTLFMSKHASELSQSTIREYVDQMGLWEEWQGIASFSVKYLGADPESFLYLKAVDHNMADRILDFVLDVRNSAERPLSKSFAMRKIQAFITGFHYIHVTRHIFPNGSRRALGFLAQDGILRCIKGN